MSIKNNSNNRQQPVSLANFIIIKRLGRGSTAHVFKIQSIKTNKIYAMKIIDKNNMHLTLTQQIRIHQMLKHPNIVQLIWEFQDAQNYYMVTQFCEGGETTGILLENIIQGNMNGNRKQYQDRIIRIAYGIAQGLNYLHNKVGIFHGDIKLGNILINDSQAKLCDFGFSAFLQQHSNNQQSSQQTLQGTLLYLSPQIIKNHCNQFPKEADIWGFGISLLILLLRGNPYTFQSQKQLRQQILSGNWNKNLEGGNALLMDLIERMLEIDVSRRITVGDILLHPVFDGMRVGMEDCEDNKEDCEDNKGDCEENKENKFDETRDSFSCIKEIQLSHADTQIQTQQNTHNPKICTYSLPPQHHNIKNQNYLKIQPNKYLTIKINKTIFKVAPNGDYLYLEININRKQEVQVTNSSKKTKIKRYRYDDLAENSRIAGYYQYALELVSLVKKRERIVNQHWDGTIFRWDILHQNGVNTSKMAYISDLDIYLLIEHNKHLQIHYKTTKITTQLPIQPQKLTPELQKLPISAPQIQRLLTYFHKLHQLHLTDSNYQSQFSSSD